MAGLDKIKSQILDEAKVTADAKIEDAKAQAEQMKLKAQEEGARQADTILKKSEADTASQKERVKSAIDLQRRTRLLEAKQEMIAEIIEKAYEKVINLAPDDYYQMLLSILEAYILPQEGEIYFSVKDLENMPVGFGKEIEEIALAKGGKLTVAGAGRDNIDSFLRTVELKRTVRSGQCSMRSGMSFQISFTGCSLYDAESIRRTSRNVQISGMFGNGGTT